MAMSWCFERKYWAEDYNVEHSAQFFCAECSTPFPRPGSFHNNRPFSAEKMYDEFPFVPWHLPPRERYEPRRFWLDRTLNAKFDHRGEFRRTFSAITIQVLLVNDPTCEQLWPS